MTALTADKNTYKRLLGHLDPYKKRFLISVLASIPASALEGALAWAIGPLLDQVFKNHNYNFLIFIPFIIVSASILQGVFEYINNHYTNYISCYVCRDIQQDLYKSLMRMDLAYFKLNSSGELYTRYYGDSILMQQAIITSLQGFVIQVFNIVFLVGVLVLRNWQFTFVALFIISFIFIPLQILSKKIRKLDYRVRTISAQVYNVFNETLDGVKEIKSFQLQKHQTSRFFKVLDEYYTTGIRMTRAGFLLKPLMEVIASVGIGAILLVGGFQVQQGHMTPGEMVSFIVALVLLYRPIKIVGGILGKIQKILAPAERVFEAMDRTPTLFENDMPKMVDEFKTLKFENVYFQYTEDKLVLKDINFTLNAGNTLALVGPSGGGKSTLVDLIPRFMDASRGRITLNDIDLKEISFASLNDLIAIVSQAPVLFDGTIAENIRLGFLNATDDMVMEAARNAHLGGWIDTLPEGINTSIGESGSLLSGGQKQRIAIARAFLKNAPILILDEATSALDNESEALIQEALTRLMVNKTVIVIAHRLSTIQFADRILVLEAGEIIESGSHDELIAQEGAYHDLYYMQFRPHPTTTQVG